MPIANFIFLIANLEAGLQSPDWPIDTNENKAVCTELRNQFNPSITACEDRNVIMVWSDSRSLKTLTDIYAQKIDSNGKELWSKNGLQISAKSGHETCAKVISDKEGGVYIFWVSADKDNNDIYGQRVDSTGRLLWDKDKAIITAKGCQPAHSVMDKMNNLDNLRLIHDRKGGAVIIWTDSRNYKDTGVDIYAQRIDKNGSKIWNEDLAVASRKGDQTNFYAVSNDAGYFIVVFEDWINSNDSNISAQCFNLTGKLQWDNNTIISSKGSVQIIPKCANDLTGGVIAVWTSNTDGDSDYNIFAQRISSEGKLIWKDDLKVTPAPGNQKYPVITPDGSGGAIITYVDESNGNSNRNIYACRAGYDGKLLWERELCTAPDNQPASIHSLSRNNFTFDFYSNLQLLNIERDKFMVIWDDNRNKESNTDIYFQILNNSGDLKLQKNGLPLSSAMARQSTTVWELSAVATDKGIVTVWSDNRNADTTGTDIYSNFINCDGKHGRIATPANLAAASLSDSQIQLTWNDSSDIEFGYKIERSSDGSSYTEIATVPQNTTYFTDSSLTESTIYYYRIKADGAADTDYSDTISATTFLKAPSEFTVNVTSRVSAIITWKNNSDTDCSVTLEKSIDGSDFVQMVKLPSYMSRFVDRSVNAVKNYSYRIRVISDSGSSNYILPELEISASGTSRARMCFLTTTQNKGSTWTLATLFFAFLLYSLLIHKVNP
ncbi:MAG: hypothetical protein HY606_12500 [Planctomycetes bacterium]|nr:hypothetical protein [Planctomycetota bacterium]